MKKLATFTAAALAVATAQFAAPASADPTGFLCGFVSTYDNLGEPNAQVGELDGGPVSSADTGTPPGDPTASVTIICTIQVGPTGATHAGPDAVSAQSSGTGVAVLAPTAITYQVAEGQDVYLCSQVVVNGVSYYWDDVPGAFSASNAATCGIAISQPVCEPGIIRPERPICL